MYVDALPELPGKVQDPFQVFLIAGIYGMRTEHEGYPFAPGEPLAFGDMLVYAALTALRAGKSACHHRPHFCAAEAEAPGNICISQKVPVPVRIISAAACIAPQYA